MQDINAIITRNFHQNINYLEAYHPTLFSKLSDYDNAVTNGHYIEKYELVYENDGFDVFERTGAKYLYQKQSSKYSSLAAQSIEYGVEENTFEGFASILLSNKQTQAYLEQEPFKHHMSGFAPIINFTQNNTPQDIKLKKIYKYIFFGTGLGLHLTTITKKIEADVYLIVEDDLELFRLSLFTTNYAALAQNAKLIFSIFEDQNEFATTADKFLKEQYYYNHYIKYFQMLSHTNTKRTEFHIAVGSQSHQLFFYHHLLIQYLQPLQYMFNGYKFLNKSLDFSALTSQEKPFLLLAAGPSLQKNIQWVEDNQEKFIIVALSATLSLLEKHQIVPDIITHLDGFKAASLHFTKLKNLKNLQNSLCFFSDRTSLEVLKLFKKEQLYLFENGTTYKENSLKPSSPCVGSLSLQLLLILKVKQFYLLGLDLAVNSQTGATHSTEHSYNRTLDIEKKLDQETIITYKESLFEVAGNMQEKVLTTAHFKSSIDTINLSLKLLKQEFQTIYNLGEGARFLNVKPKNILNIHLQKWKKKDTLEAITTLINQEPLQEFTAEEIQALKNKYNKAEEFQTSLLSYKNMCYKDSKEYLENLLALIEKLTTTQLLKEHELSRVFDGYLRYIISYIFDFFNHENIIEEKVAIEKLNHFLTTHLLQIVTQYMKTLETKLHKG
jgi:hypothetical protein